MDHLLAEIRYSTEHSFHPTADNLTHFCAAVNQRAKRPLITHHDTGGDPALMRDSRDETGGST